MKGIINISQLTFEQWDKIVNNYKKLYEESKNGVAEYGWMAEGGLNVYNWLFGEDISK